MPKTRRNTKQSSQSETEFVNTNTTDKVEETSAGPSSDNIESCTAISKLENGDDILNDSFDENSCAICLEEMVHPVQTPCKHNFCFLCLKGVTLTNGYTCPLCRQGIKPDFIHKPHLLTPPPLKRKKSALKSSAEGGSCSKEAVEPTYQWYYKGMSGWWRYDARANEEIEAAYNEGKDSINLLLSGFNFKIDLKSMYQQKADGCGLMRDIKRDVPTCKAKGTAGLTSKILAGTKRRRQNSKGS